MLYSTVIISAFTCIDAGTAKYCAGEKHGKIAVKRMMDQRMHGIKLILVNSFIKRGDSTFFLSA